MYCPVCGGKAEKIIDYMGAKVCPECGCVIEVPVNGVTSKSKREIDLLKVVKILSIISIIFIVIGLIDSLLNLIYSYEYEYSEYYILQLINLTMLAMVFIFMNIKKDIPLKAALTVYTAYTVVSCVKDTVPLLGVNGRVLFSLLFSFSTSLWLVGYVSLICSLIFALIMVFKNKIIYGRISKIVILYLITNIFRFFLGSGTLDLSVVPIVLLIYALYFFVCDKIENKYDNVMSL